MANYASGVIKLAENEIGYIEKASNSNLDSKTDNRGTKNYTKYSRDINKIDLLGCQGQAWCGTFQFWLEMKAVGLEQALKNWNMTKSSYTGYNCFSTYNAFKRAGKVSSVPKLGCLVIFTFSHMARVVEIDEKNKKFTTIEGNTSAKTYDRNGGMVAKKTYSFNDKNIKGFCIINYDTESSQPKPTNSTKKVSDTKMPTIKKGSKGKAVEIVQVILDLSVDGDFGTKTHNAVVAFQKKKGLTQDGIVGANTWKALLESV